MPPATNANGKHGKRLIRAQFKDIPVTPGYSFITAKAQCRHCEAPLRAQNVTLNQRKHLNTCARWRRHQIKQGMDPESERAKQPAVSDVFAVATPALTATNSTELFALAIYTSTASFSLFTTPEQKAFHANLGFKAPNRDSLSTTLLEKCYLKVKRQVQLVADAATHIQIVTDGSSNIGKVRVENTSFLVDGISYYWNSIAIRAVRAGADWTVKNVIQNAKEITKNALHRWTSFSSDTCNTQRKVWAVLNSTEEASHVLSIPCDSHGIQLIFKDLLFLERTQLPSGRKWVSFSRTSRIRSLQRSRNPTNSWHIYGKPC